MNRKARRGNADQETKKNSTVAASRPLCVLSVSAVPSSPEPDPLEPIPLLERIDCGHFHPHGICPKCGRGHGWKIHLQPGGEGKFVPAPSDAGIPACSSNPQPPRRKALGLRYTR